MLPVQEKVTRANLVEAIDKNEFWVYNISTMGLLYPSAIKRLKGDARYGRYRCFE